MSGMSRSIAPLFLASFCCLFPCCLFGQQNSSCLYEVPVGAIGPGRKLISRLDTSAFEVQKSKGHVTVKSSSYDTSPRRIVLVVERGHQMNEPATRITDEVIQNLLQRARPTDSFALLTAGENPTSIHFGQDSSSILKAYKNPPGILHEHLPLLDAIAEAGTWLDPPAPGDAVLVFAGQDKFSDSRTRFNSLYDSFLQRKIRVFTLLFNYLVREMTPSPPLIGISPNTALSPEDDDLGALSWGTGGYIVIENTQDVVHRYKLDDAKLQGMRQSGWVMYGAIAEYYQMQLEEPANEKKSRPWQLGVSREVLSKYPNAEVLFPKTLLPCTGAPQWPPIYRSAAAKTRRTP